MKQRRLIIEVPEGTGGNGGKGVHRNKGIKEEKKDDLMPSGTR